MKVYEFRGVGGCPGGLLIVEDVSRLDTEPAEVQALLSALTPESRARLELELMCFETHQQAHSRRIKRGIRAAKERRQKDH